jgi:hypothetical protein
MQIADYERDPEPCAGYPRGEWCNFDHTEKFDQ